VLLPLKLILKLLFFGCGGREGGGLGASGYRGIGILELLSGILGVLAIAGSATTGHRKKPLRASLFCWGGIDTRFVRIHTLASSQAPLHKVAEKSNPSCAGQLLRSDSSVLHSVWFT
jgi:hypothetical protein